MNKNTDTDTVHKEDPETLKILDILTGNPGFGDKTQKIAGIILSAVLFAALAAYCCIMLEINILLSLVLFSLMGIACVKYRLYRLMFCSSVTVHLLCVLIGIIYGVKTGDMISEETSEFYRIACEITGAVGCFGFAEISFGALPMPLARKTTPNYFLKHL